MEDQRRHFQFGGCKASHFLLGLVKKTSVSDDDGKQDWFSILVPSSSGTSLQVSGLSPATYYQFSVLSQNKFGTGSFSEIATARTLGQYFFPSFISFCICISGTCSLKEKYAYIS
ncbi:hypothetical protein GOODEAATRI_021760 [Goodea atripinnis]|uniref:Fibronectin type-III domain-containing protein n=1 Tax=Goodea atripinnis TaxID=208336 RepID=A0ABV0NWL5_9TELE